MKVLFILKDNFPDSGACTSLLNNIFFKGRMSDEIESISVLAIKDNYGCSEKFIYNGITVYNMIMMSRVPVKQYKQVFSEHPLIAIKGIVEKIISKSSPDAVNRKNARYIEREIEKLDVAGFDVIVAVMGYFDVAAAAMEYKKKKPNVKLVIYQVDPCSTNESYSASTKEERENFEKELYTVSDKIITTPILFKESKRLYTEEITDKMIQMEFPNVVPVSSENGTRNKDIRCLFTGSIYGYFRDPKYTLRLFDKAESQIKFEIIGSVKPELKKEFERHTVLYHGSKSLDETKTELLKADVLVNIGNAMINQVPSKLFEYISYGKPIVNICKSRSCPTISYLEKYKYVLNLFEEDENFDEQAAKLNDFILKNQNSRMTCEEIANSFEACTPEYCAVKMIEALKN